MTLLEVMMASSVLLVCLTALAGVLGGSISSSQISKARDEATNLANLRIEAARSMSYDRVGVRYANGLYGDPVGDILTPETVGKFTVTTECSWVRDAGGRATYKKLTVHVAWQAPTPGEIVVTTMVYGKSAIATSGDLVIRLHYAEDTAPVSNATVLIQAADGTSRAVVSNSAGEAFFGQVAVGAVGVAVSPPDGSLVDTRTLGASVSADQLATLDVIVQRQATQAKVHVTDTSGATVAGASVSLLRSDGVAVPAATTDAVGDAVFPNLYYSNYTATVSKSGYTTSTANVAVTVASPQPVTPVSVSKLVGVGLRVRVFDVNGTQVPGASIVLTQHIGGSIVQQGVGGTNGEFSFANFGAGGYDITVGKTAYTSQTVYAWLYDGDNRVIDVHLVQAVTNGTLSVTTKDKNGHLRSIAVTITGPYPTTGTSNGSGLLTLTLITGSYKVRCTSEPASADIPIIISAGQTTVVTVSQTK